MCFRLLLLFVSLSLLNVASANTRCYKVIGNVTCSVGEMDRPVEIHLLDEDGLPWESDDLMGRSWANKDGQFKVEGCGNDLGWNDPDPYLKFIHTCKDKSQGGSDVGHFVQSKMLVSEAYLPNVITLDEIDLYSLEVVG